MTDIIDSKPPRFGRIRWWLVRKILDILNRVEARLALARELALEEAVAASPDFATFETWVTEHYAARGKKVKVDVIEAVVPPLTPAPTHNNPSSWVH